MQLRRLPKVSPRISPCFFAGYCLCSTDRGKRLALAVERLQLAMSRFFAKGTVARSIYAKGLAVLRIVETDVPGDVGMWLHIGYGNLSTNIYSCTVLSLHSEEDDRVMLEPVSKKEAPRSMNIWECLGLKALAQGRNCEYALSVEMWTLDQRPEFFVDVFTPRRITAIKVESCARVLFWRPGCGYPMTAAQCECTRFRICSFLWPNPPPSTSPGTWIIRLLAASPATVPAQQCSSAAGRRFISRPAAVQTRR